MRVNKLLAFAAAFVLLIFPGCDNLEVQSVDEFVVEAYLIAGEQLPIVRLSRATSLEEQYNFTRLAIRDASARIDLLAEDGSVETTFPYEERNDLYWPLANHDVTPGRSYRITVDIPGASELLTSTTLVPGDFEIISAAPDSVLYQAEEQFEVNVTESFYPGRQAVYVFSVESLDPSVDNLTPFYSEVIDAEDNPEDIEDVIVNESFVINEANFEIHPDGTYSIKLPWLAVAFYGPNSIIVNTLDDNMFDFVRSHTVQQGGSTFSPGEIPNVIDHVQGGTGVFGSITRREAEVFIKDREL